MSQLDGQRQERLERFRLDGLAFDCGNAGDPTAADSSDRGSEVGASWKHKMSDRPGILPHESVVERVHRN